MYIAHITIISYKGEKKSKFVLRIHPETDMLQKINLTSYRWPETFKRAIQTQEEEKSPQVSIKKLLNYNSTTVIIITYPGKAVNISMNISSIQ